MVLKRIGNRYALVSKSNPNKILKWFGTTKPSKQQVRKEEKRIQFFKAVKAGKIPPSKIKKASVRKHVRRTKTGPTTVRKHTRKVKSRKHRRMAAEPSYGKIKARTESEKIIESEMRKIDVLIQQQDNLIELFDEKHQENIAKTKEGVKPHISLKELEARQADAKKEKDTLLDKRKKLEEELKKEEKTTKKQKAEKETEKEITDVDDDDILEKIGKERKKEKKESEKKLKKQQDELEKLNKKLERQETRFEKKLKQVDEKLKLGKETTKDEVRKLKVARNNLREVLKEINSEEKLLEEISEMPEAFDFPLSNFDRMKSFFEKEIEDPKKKKIEEEADIFKKLGVRKI